MQTLLCFHPNTAHPPFAGAARNYRESPRSWTTRIENSLSLQFLWTNGTLTVFRTQRHREGSIMPCGLPVLTIGSFPCNLLHDSKAPLGSFLLEKSVPETFILLSEGAVDLSISSLRYLLPRQIDSLTHSPSETDHQPAVISSTTTTHRP